MAAEDELDSPKRQREQQWEWRVERAGWFVIGAVLIAGLAGLLGPGLFSRRTVHSSDGSVRVEYQAMERYEAPATLRIAVRLPQEGAQNVRLAVSRTLADQVMIEQIVPTPSNVERDAETVFYTFKTASQTGTLDLVLRYKPNEFGWRRCEIGLADGELARLRQFVWP